MVFLIYIYIYIYIHICPSAVRRPECGTRSPLSLLSLLLLLLVLSYYLLLVLSLSLVSSLSLLLSLSNYIALASLPLRNAKARALPTSSDHSPPWIRATRSIDCVGSDIPSFSFSRSSPFRSRGQRVPLLSTQLPQPRVGLYNII